MSFYIFAWLASFLFGCDIVIAKLTSKYAIHNPWYFNFLWSLIHLFFIIPVALANHVGIPQYWDNLLLASLCDTLSGIFFILALYRLDLSVLSPLFNFKIVFSVILGALFLGEILTPFQYVLIGLIFGAGLFVSLDEKMKLKSFFRLTIVFAMCLNLFTALSSVFIKKSIAQNGYWETTFWTVGIAQIFLLATIPLFLKEVRKTSLKQVSSIGLITLFSTLGNLAANWAYKENVSISSVIISLPISMMIAFLFSIVAPKLLEKHTLKVYAIRFIAAAVMIVSALKLSS